MTPRSSSSCLTILPSSATSAIRERGYALESSREVMHLARNVFGIRRVVAITSTDNQGSMNLLRKIGLRFDRTMALPGHSEVVNVFVPQDATNSGAERRQS